MVFDAEAEIQLDTDRLNAQGFDLGIRYVLERRDPDGNSVAHELTWVENRQLETPMKVTTNWPVNDDEDGQIQFSRSRKNVIVLSGATGVEERPSATANGSVATLDGQGRIAALQRFIDRYVEMSASMRGALNRNRPTPTQPYPWSRLFLHALYEGWSYELTKADLQETVSVDQAVGDCIWVLRCETLKKITRDRPVLSPLDDYQGTRSSEYDTQQRDAAAARAKLVDEQAALSKITVAPRSSLEDAFDVFDTARFAVERGIVAMRSVPAAQASRLRANVEKANLLLARVAEARGVVAQLKAFPGALFSAALNTVGAALEEIVEANDELPSGPVFSSALRDLSAAYVDFRIKALVKLGQLRVPYHRDVDESTDMSFDTQPVLRDGEALRAVFLGSGETLPELALRVLGDRAQWERIAEVNNLSDPWRLRDGSPMAAAGASLLVPAADLIGAPRERAWSLIGQSYYIDPTTGDLQMVNGGFLRIGELPLVLQAIRERGKATRPRTQAAPEWGLLEVVGAVVQQNDAIRFAVDARAQFLRDARVVSVSNLRLRQEGDTIQLDLIVQTVGGEAPYVVSTPVPLA